MTNEQQQIPKKVKQRRSRRQKHLETQINDILDITSIKPFLNEGLIEEVKDFYIKIDPQIVQGYSILVKFRMILYLIMVYKYRLPVFFHEFEIDSPVRHTQALKGKLIREYKRIYETDLKVLPLKAIEYLPRVIDYFNIPEEYAKKIRYILEKTYRRFRFKNPKTFLGSIVYHVCRRNVTQKDLGAFLDITPYGIRKVYQEVLKTYPKLEEY